MDTLRIHLFGPLRVYRGEAPLNRFPTYKVQRLFCYLVLHREHVHSRDILASLLWGDRPEEQARKCLRTTLWRLRSFLEPDGRHKGAYLVIENNDVSFNTRSDYWLDVEEFENHVSGLQLLSTRDIDAGSPAEEVVTNLTRAVELYQGDLLEGWYDDWCPYERERLHDLFVGALAKLMGYHHSQGAYEEAIRFGQRILNCDSLLESVHREMMRLHCLAGNRGLAVRQYQLCRATLAKELGIEPMQETTALYEQICRSGEIASDDRETGVADQSAHSDMPEKRKSRRREVRSSLVSHVDHALSELLLVRTEIQQLSPRFQKAVDTLESLKQELGRAKGT